MVDSTVAVMVGLSDLSTDDLMVGMSGVATADWLAEWLAASMAVLWAAVMVWQMDAK